MAKSLTVKQRKFIANKAKGMSGAEAARRAGYSPRSAREIAAENLSKPNVREAFLAAMEEAGITDKKLNQVMREGLEANRVVAARVIKGRPTNIDEELAEANERTDDFIEVPDHATRHKFLETAIDVKGTKAPKEANVRVTSLEDLIATLDDEAGAGEEG